MSNTFHAGTTHKSNPEQLTNGDNPQFEHPHAGTINESNLEQFLVSNDPHGDKPQVKHLLGGGAGGGGVDQLEA